MLQIAAAERAVVEPVGHGESAIAAAAQTLRAVRAGSNDKSRRVARTRARADAPGQRLDEEPDKILQAAMIELKVAAFESSAAVSE